MSSDEEFGVRGLVGLDMEELLGGETGVSGKVGRVRAGRREEKSGLFLYTEHDTLVLALRLLTIT